MKLVIWSLILILLVGFVNAEIKISCETDSECYLINKDSSCVQNYCYKPDFGYITLEDFQPRNNDFQWNIMNIEPKTVRCDNCLFAPEKENWLTRFVDWMFFIK